MSTRPTDMPARLADAITAYLSRHGDDRAREAADNPRTDSDTELYLADAGQPGAFTHLLTLRVDSDSDDQLIAQLDHTIRVRLAGTLFAPGGIGAADPLIAARMVHSDGGPAMHIYAVDGDGQVLRADWDCTPEPPHFTTDLAHGPIGARLTTLRHLIALSRPVAAGGPTTAATPPAGIDGLDQMIQDALGAVPDWTELAVASVNGSDTVAKWLAGIGELFALDRMRALAVTAYETLADPTNPHNLDDHGIEIEDAVSQYNTLTGRRDEIVTALQATGRSRQFLEPAELAEAVDSFPRT